MIAVVIVTVFVCLILAYVAQPIIGGARRESENLKEIAIDEAQDRKRAALLAIVDIEEEREIGKLAEADFEALRAQYEAQALESLRELDLLVAGVESERDELEAEIAAMRAEMTCPHCGALRSPGSRSGPHEEPEPCARCGR